jgi:CRP-like cAMP-binding protein
VQRVAASDWRSLKKLKGLGWLSAHQIGQLETHMRARKVRRQETIFFEGERSEHVYILLSGAARLMFLTRDNQRVLVGFVNAGEIFGVSSLLPQMRRPFRCEAFTDCWVGSVKTEIFVEVVLGVPLPSLRRTMDATVGRWWGMLLRYANFRALALRERLAVALLELGEKFGVKDARGTILTLNFTHGDLAELVGASRQRITEQISEFEREKALLREGRRLILVPERLSEVACLDVAEWRQPSDDEIAE